jgi:phage/plasmid-associated DNA primase
MPEPKILTDNIPHEYILMPNIKHAFAPIGVGLKWSLEECEFKKSSNQYISVVYYLKDTNYAVVDIDTDDYSLDQLYDDTEIDGVSVKGNTTGYHVWVQFEHGKPDAYSKNVVKCSNLCEMDFLGEKVFERVGKEWSCDEDPPYLHAHQIEKCFIMDKFTTKTKAENNKQESSGDKALLKKLVDLIHMKYCDNRDDWLKIMFAMKKCGFTEEEAREWSMQSDRYTECGFDTAWDQYFVEEITAGEGTIRYYAKLSNPTEYKKMTVKIFPTEPTDRDFAELFWELAGDCCIVSNNTMYLYYKNQWRIIDKKEPHILRTMIGDTIREYFENQLKIVKDKEDMKEYKNILDYMKQICGKSKLSNVSAFVMDKMYSEHCDTEDIFDNKPYIFAFKNQAFDLQKGELYDIKKEDYITQNTGYDYVKPNAKQMATVKNVFHSIFPDPEVGKCYLSVLRLCLSGEHPEKLFLANGGGRNGKGLLNELMFMMLGEYAYKLSIEVLTKDVKKTGANPELANMHKKRMVLSNEPEDGTKLQMGIIKEITGGKEISARGLYNGNTKTLLNCASIVECNKKPLLNGRMDTSVLERIVDIPFESTFVSNPEDVDASKGIYQGNTLYKTDNWQKEHACAMFQFILEHAEKSLYVPERIKNLSKQYVLGSDEMYGWIMENYETADNTEFVRLKDVFDLYKASDLYSNLTKLEKRNLNKNAFSELISHHIVLKKQFRNDKVRIGGKIVNCERIHGLKLKPPDDCDTDDEELGAQC